LIACKSLDKSCSAPSSLLVEHRLSALLIKVVGNTSDSNSQREYMTRFLFLSQCYQRECQRWSMLPFAAATISCTAFSKTSGKLSLIHDFPLCSSTNALNCFNNFISFVAFAALLLDTTSLPGTLLLILLLSLLLHRCLLLLLRLIIITVIVFIAYFGNKRNLLRIGSNSGFGSGIVSSSSVLIWQSPPPPRVQIVDAQS
jgi:hypothetical protein